MSARENSLNSSHEPGSIREVIHVSWPIVIGMLSYTAMGVADTLFVGWLGTTELAAVGLATTAIFLVNSFFLGSLHGVKVVAAQATGADKPGRAVASAWAGIALAVPFGLLVIALGSVDAHIFRWMGGSPEVQALAQEYFGVRVLAAPLWYVTIAICDYYQGTGDTRTPMKLNLLVNGLNIGLDAVLVFGLGPFPALGVAGAAWATAIACGIGMVTIGWRFLRRVSSTPAVERELVREVLALGLPIGVRYALGVGSWTILTSLLARMGEAELAAHQIAIRIISVSFLPGYGISEAATVLVGQYVGANEPDKARRSFLSSLVVAMAVMGSFGMLFWVIPDVLLGVFQAEPEVAEVGRRLLQIAAIFQLLDAVAMVATGALNGAGDTRYTMMASVTSSWMVLLPAAWFFGVSLDMGPFGAWVGLTAEMFVLSIILVHRQRSKLGASAGAPALAPAE